MCNDSFIVIIWPQITQPGFYVQVAILSASFICSVLGVILDVVFICCKKTNFLVRLFVYLMVATTIELGSVWPHMYNIILVQCDESVPPIDLLGIIYFYCAWVEAVIACSINVMLMKKLYNYTCGTTSTITYASCWRNQINSHPKCMEAIIVTVLFGLPVVLTIITATIGISSGTTYLILLAVVAIIPVFLSLLGNVVLLIWFCWLRIRRVARIRTRTMLKEMTLFFLLLIATLLAWLFLFLPPMPFLVVSTILSVFIAILPYLLLLYMWLSFRIRSSTRQVHMTHGENRNLRINPRTTGLETAPPSTRVSLPSDTADHAPNFLSRSGDESSEVTPLLNNN